MPDWATGLLGCGAVLLFVYLERKWRERNH